MNVGNFIYKYILICFSYYDGDQEKLFLEAHVISPFKKTPNPKKVSEQFISLDAVYIAGSSVHRWKHCTSLKAVFALTTF